MKKTIHLIAKFYGEWSRSDINLWRISTPSSSTGKPGTIATIKDPIYSETNKSFNGTASDTTKQLTGYSIVFSAIILFCSCDSGMRRTAELHQKRSMDCMDENIRLSMQNDSLKQQIQQLQAKHLNHFTEKPPVLF